MTDPEYKRKWYAANRMRTEKSRKVYVRNWRRRNPERVAEYNKKSRVYYQENRQQILDRKLSIRTKLRDDVLLAYGGVCVCCEEPIKEFLTVDHVNDDGSQHRALHDLKSGTMIYRWLRDNGYPPGFQTMCWNCNCGRARNGGICPHKEQHK